MFMPAQATMTFLNKVLGGLRSIVSPSLKIGRALALARGGAGPDRCGGRDRAVPGGPRPARAVQDQAALLPDLSHIGGGPATLVKSQEQRPNNWGTHASCARVMIARYIGDAAELERRARLRASLGDRASYAGFEYGEPRLR